MSVPTETSSHRPERQSSPIMPLVVIATVTLWLLTVFGPLELTFVQIVTPLLAAALLGVAVAVLSLVLAITTRLLLRLTKP